MSSADNRSSVPFLLVFFTLIILVALTYIPTGFSLWGWSFNKVDLLSEVRRKPPSAAPRAAAPVTRMVDSLKKKAASEVVADKTHIKRDFMTYTGIIQYGDTGSEASGMVHFYQALHDLKTGKRKKVRIAYFGDSMIEGDLITGTVRRLLQNYFGGNGVGFVPVTSIVAGFRNTVVHTFSKDWEEYNFKDKEAGGRDLGLSGHAFYPEAGSWVRLAPVHRPHLDELHEITLFYGPAEEHPCRVSTGGATFELDGSHRVNELELKADSAATAVRFQFDPTGPVDIYGFSLESDSGIFLDNYAFRGISGVELPRIPEQVTQGMQSVHPYDLIVLHYGPNVLFNPRITKFGWYERPMKKTMAYLRSNFPNTSILLVGTADKAARVQGEYQTQPGVLTLLDLQHRLAEEYGCAFWNLFSAMGGAGSMVQWVEGDTVYANKDYTHLNFRGAERVGALLYNSMIKDFESERYK
ncbi:hypothetical protein [Compostibacter hankyongensis]|uniref:SGNH/GDSL hydrolase family protein n=1 Tax=Compostibacter hankyongensis TaxID=1007089 RepID=A0ABP8FHQ8_9BACT